MSNPSKSGKASKAPSKAPTAVPSKAPTAKSSTAATAAKPKSQPGSVKTSKTALSSKPPTANSSATAIVKEAEKPVSQSGSVAKISKPPSANSSVTETSTEVEAIEKAASNSGSEKALINLDIETVDEKPTSQSGSAKALKSPESTTAQRSGPVQATRSFVYVDDAQGSMMYEKDGQWQLDKIPEYRVRGQKSKFLSKPMDQDDLIEMDESGADALEKDLNSNPVGPNDIGGEGSSAQGATDLGVCGCQPVEPAIAGIDAWIGQDSIPCNLCDPPKERENDLIPMWHWLYTIVTDLTAKAKEYKRTMSQNDASCGGSDNVTIAYNATVETLLVSTKGTQSTLNVKKMVQPVDTSGGSMLYEKEGQWQLEKMPDWSKVKEKPNGTPSSLKTNVKSNTASSSELPATVSKSVKIIEPGAEAVSEVDKTSETDKAPSTTLVTIDEANKIPSATNVEIEKAPSGKIVDKVPSKTTSKIETDKIPSATNVEPAKAPSEKIVETEKAPSTKSSKVEIDKTPSKTASKIEPPKAPSTKPSKTDQVKAASKAPSAAGSKAPSKKPSAAPSKTKKS